MSTEAHPSAQCTHWIGLDVAKDTFDAAAVPAGCKFPATPMREIPARTFPRTPKGVRNLLAWIDSVLEGKGAFPVRAVMEATGHYSKELASWLLEQRPELAPAIVHAQHTAAFMQSLGLRNSTDKLCARALGFYGAEREPEPFKPPKPEVVELRELSRYRDSLMKEKIAEENRLQCESASSYVRKVQKWRIRGLQRDIDKIDKEMGRLTKQSPELSRDMKLLQTIYGAGFATAVVTIAEMGDLRDLSKARQLTAYTGLSPRHVQSGTSVSARPRMCKCGNSRIRKALYMAALAAIRKEGDFQRCYQNLLQRGKSRMAALGAIMRKLLTVMRAILIHKQPYDPHWKTRGKLGGQTAQNPQFTP